MAVLEIPWRTGANLRELAYYSPEYMQHIHNGGQLLEQQLQALKAMKVKLVRFFACHRGASSEAAVARIKVVLDRMDALDMQAIICLDDSVSPEFAVPRKHPDYTRTNTGHMHKKYWHDRHYVNDYLPHIKPIVRAFASHPAVLAWELGNEYAVHPRPYEPTDGDAFIKFARAASEAIKTIAPKHLVSTGLVNSRQVGPDSNWEAFSSELYGLPTIDLISIHYYDDDGEKDYSSVDVEVAKRLKKPFYIGEVGALAGHHGGKHNRPQFLREEIREWKKRGAFCVLPWAFDTSEFDVGVSDTKSFARIFTDFEDIKRVMVNFGEDVARVVVPDSAQASASAGAAESATTTFSAQTAAQSENIGETNDAAQKTAQTASAPATRVFKVIYQHGLNIRETPRRDGKHLGGYNQHDRVVVYADSRMESEDVVWWRHDRGWSAEVDRRNNLVLMEEVGTQERGG